MAKQHPDQRFTDGLLMGDTVVTEEIYKKCFPIIRRMVLDNSGSHKDAKDTFQDTILAAFERADASKPLILTCAICTYLRGVPGINGVRSFEEEPNIEDRITETEEAEEKYRRKEKAFRQLSERCQKLITLAFDQGLSTEEMVKALHFSNANAYYVRKKKCLDRLRKLIEDQNN